MNDFPAQNNENGVESPQGQPKTDEGHKGLQPRHTAKRQSPADSPAPILLVLPIEQLVGNDGQARQKQRDEASWELFVESVRQHGIKQPPLVRWLGGDRYLVVDGHGRLAAAKQCGLKSVPCMIEQAASSEAEDLRLQFITNQHREGLCPLDQAHVFQRLRKLGMTQKQIEVTLGVSQSYVSDCLAVLEKGSPDLIEKVKASTVSLKKAVAIIRAEQEQQKASNGSPDSPFPSPKNKATKRTPTSQLIAYPEFEHQDETTGLRFVTYGKKKSSPPTENVLAALKHYVSVLELQVKHDA
jgi:ParB/RepB/Spo0J family partition protein